MLVAQEPDSRSRPLASFFSSWASALGPTLVGISPSGSFYAIGCKIDGTNLNC